MALQQNLTLPSEVALPDAYHRVTSFSGSKTTAGFLVETYKDKDTSDRAQAAGPLLPPTPGAVARPMPVMTRNYTFTPDLSANAPNHLAQCYAHLKTIDDFKTATDV